MYKNYIFDLYGTLADIRTDEEDGYLWQKMSEIYHAYGAVYTPEKLQQKFRETERLEVRAAAERARKYLRSSGKETLPEEYVEADLTNVFRGLYSAKDVPCSSELARMTAVTFRALSRKYIKLYDGVTELLEELKKRKKHIYMLSNAQSDFTRPEISMLGLERYFDGIFLSSEQGVKKPSPLFFEKLLTVYHIAPEESVMIGNDERADVAGANRVGMDSLYIHTAISPQDTGEVTSTYRIMDGDFQKIRKLVLK